MERLPALDMVPHIREWVEDLFAQKGQPNVVVNVRPRFSLVPGFPEGEPDRKAFDVHVRIPDVPRLTGEIVAASREIGPPAPVAGATIRDTEETTLHFSVTVPV